MNVGIKILVVDDFATMRRIVKGALKKTGFENIIEAEDGKQALDELKKDHIDLVVSDWNMPNMNGLELLKTIRADKELHDIPFIMVTSEGQKANILEAVQSGVSNYVVKPFTPEILNDKIKKIFKE